jgi:hypothetical protein
VGVALATDSGVAAWSYAPELWGRCGQRLAWHEPSELLTMRALATSCP